jgi:hypothetical protein
VPVLPVRSAAPDITPGTTSRVALIAFSIALRVAIFSPMAKLGSFVSQPATPRCAQHASHPARSPLHAANRWFHAACAVAPLAATRRRYSATTSAGAQNVVSLGMPRISFVRAISSGGNGSPCAFGLSVNSGDGQPM